MSREGGEGRKDPEQGAQEPAGNAPDPEGISSHAGKKPAAQRLTRRSMVVGGGLAGVALFGAGAVTGREVFPASDVERDEGDQGDKGADGDETPGEKTAATSDDHSDGSDKAGDGGKKDQKPPMRTYSSTDLTVPVMSTWRVGPATPGLLFVAPKSDDYHGVIVDDAGEPVWIEPTGATVMDLRVQTFRGEPVITYWSGTIDAGHGAGQGVILDRHYQTVATVRARNGVEADLHEFHLTADGTALVTAYPTIEADLSAIGGAKSGYIYDARAQEIDVETGEVLLDFSAHDHLTLDETYRAPDDDKDHDGRSADHAFDPYHLNSIDDDGDRLYLSMRHTHTVYAIDRRTGTILWRFGGRRSDFAVPPTGRFAWQHDVRRQHDGTFTLFDNNRITQDEGGQSRGLRFELDETTGTATVVDQYAYDRTLATAMGGVQQLPGGHVLVGWGTSPTVTEFDADAEPVFVAQLGGMSYRAARHVWTGHPRGGPAIAVGKVGYNLRVHLSWNGATEVAHWRIHAGESASELAEVATVPRSAFETSTRIGPAKVVYAEALDAARAVLGSTDRIEV